jgi:hypothetical protein
MLLHARAPLADQGYLLRETTGRRATPPMARALRCPPDTLEERELIALYSPASAGEKAEDEV